MKVLGLSGENYICHVSHDELEKFLNTYYNGRTDRLKVGQEVDLGRGWTFMRDTQRALDKTEEFIAAHAEVIQAITDGITFASHYYGGKQDGSQL